VSASPDWAAVARRHGRLRWVGIVLFCVAAGVLLLRLVLVAQGTLPPVRGLLPCVAGLGFSLGAFGTANDTALHAMTRLRDPGAFGHELAHERAVRPARLAAVHAAPRAALVLPVLASLLLAWLGLGPFLAAT
jgi:hypothetical protein